VNGPTGDRLPRDYSKCHACRSLTLASLLYDLQTPEIDNFSDNITRSTTLVKSCLRLHRRGEFQSLLLLKCRAMGRSSEWSVPKDPSERVSGLACYQVSHTVYQNGSSRRRILLGHASRPFRPQSLSSEPSPSQPIRSRSAPIRLEPSHRRFTPSLQSDVHQIRLLSCHGSGTA
jgi:hypothetical protein